MNHDQHSVYENDESLEIQKRVSMIKSYLSDAGFDSSMYFLKKYRDSIEVDFDDNKAVFYLLEDIKKTKYIEHFDVDYKKPANSRRHTAVFTFVCQ